MNANFIASIFAFLLTVRLATANPWVLTPEPKSTTLVGFQDALDLSGISRCGDFYLVASDENQVVQIGKLDAVTGCLQYVNSISLVQQKLNVSGGGKKKKKLPKIDTGELDLEALCYSEEEKAFYATGSHGLGKKQGDFERLRFGVFRIPYDPVTQSIVEDQITETSLLPWLQACEEFKHAALVPLQANGFNIEGIAYVGTKLYFGVRGPSVDGTAYIIETEPKALFLNRGNGVTMCVHSLPLGAHRGIRELTHVQGGFLAIAGNAAAAPSKKFPFSSARNPDSDFTLHFIELTASGTLGTPQLVGNVSKTDGLAEGLLVMQDDGATLDIMVIYDGLEQGAAARFRATRPLATKTSAYNETLAP